MIDALMPKIGQGQPGGFGCSALTLKVRVNCGNTQPIHWSPR